MSDNNLHKIVREKLSEIQPDFQPKDWLEMRKKLYFQRFRTYIILGTLLFVFSGIYITYHLQSTDNQKVNVKKSSIIEQKNISDITKKVEVKQKRVVSHSYSIPKENSVELQKNEILEENTLENQPEIKEVELQTEFLPTLEKIQNHGVTKIKETPKNLSIDYEKKLRSLERIKQIKELGETFELTPKTVLGRNINHWKNVVIVCDFTSSMYPYGTQVFEWLSQNLENEKIKGVVFFTDCDSLGNQTDGSVPAKMFWTREKNEDKLWELMLAAVENTNYNLDFEENNVEAAIFAQHTFEDADEIVMIADNASGVKDMKLLSSLKKPVHVIICGETDKKNQPFQRDFLKIVSKTKGTIHTLENDLEDIEHLKNYSRIVVGKKIYEVRQSRFIEIN